jgi:hypothetical protein
VRSLLAVLAEQLTGPVVTQAINNQYLNLPTGLEILCEHRVEEFANMPFLVAARNDDRYLHRCLLLIAVLTTRATGRPARTPETFVITSRISVLRPGTSV